MEQFFITNPREGLRMTNFIKSSIDYLEKNQIFCLTICVCLLFALLFSLCFSISNPMGKKLMCQTSRRNCKKTFDPKRFKESVKHAVKMYFNQWASYKELRDMKKNSK
jgi:hypothetical protein